MLTVNYMATVVSGYVTPRLGPSRSYDFYPPGKLVKGDTFPCDRQVTDETGIVWVRLKRTGFVEMDLMQEMWFPNLVGDYMYVSTPVAHADVADNGSIVNHSLTVNYNAVEGRYSSLYNQDSSSESEYGLPDENLSSSKKGSVAQDNINYVEEWYEANDEGFPKTTKVKNSDGSITRVSDYSISFSSDFLSLVNAVRKNLNITSAYDKYTINKKYHFEFNRFRIEHPDIMLRNTTGYVVFTRPDLNLFYTKSDGSIDTTKFSSEMKVDPRVRYITNHNPAVAKALTKEGVTGHNFNPFLTNMVQSLEVMDDSVDTLETGETWTGFKLQYSKHNIKSITAGTLSIKFRESFDLGITNMFQLWVDYQSNVYRGIFTPKVEYIWQKCLDYACDVYYFLLDQDGETILFWSKYYGVFPLNVGKSVFSYDYGSQVQLPEISQSFAYMYKEDLSPNTLVEFNKDAKIAVNAAGIPYVPVYNVELGHCGSTWAGVPFISTCASNNGITSDAQGFKLRFSPEKTITNTTSSNLNP